MCASTSDERRTWVKLIRAIAAQANPPTSPPPPTPTGMAGKTMATLDDAARAATIQELRENQDARAGKVSKALEGAIKSRPFASAVTYNDIPSM